MSDETTELQGILDEFEHECFMLRVEASETRAKDDVVRKSYERIRDESMERIAATLVSDRESELQSALNKAAGNWARADERAKALESLVREMFDTMRGCVEYRDREWCEEHGCECVFVVDVFEERMKELGVM